MRTRRGLWLLEKVFGGEFLGARLPSKEQVLLVYICRHKEMTETFLDATKHVPVLYFKKC